MIVRMLTSHTKILVVISNFNFNFNWVRNK